MPGVREAAAELAGKHSAGKPVHPPCLPLQEPLPATAPCVAVDGSHVVLLDTGALWVVATRVAAVPWPAPPPLEPEADVVAATPDQALDRLQRDYTAWGLEPPRAASAEAFAQGLRALDEAKAAVQAVATMPKGALLLVDGALRGLPPGPQALAERILAAGERAGVEVVGVAKRSSLARDGVPLVSALQESGPAGAWAAEVEPGVFVARLHAASPHAFRVDAGSRATVARLVPLARDAVYTGYPYPLAVAHNAVALTGAHARELRARLREEVRRQGGAPAAALLAAFHDIHDRNAPG
ncbi:MAG: hypothetical protein LC620_04035 [Halobacteriales archaeon]|nr:hypothetical protein [Halobacteriales archaeon]